MNQKAVYSNNITLARRRLANIQSMKRQGMVTQNDVLRTELVISDLLLLVSKVDSDIEMVNNRLTALLYLADSVHIIPDTSLLRHFVYDDLDAGILFGEANRNNRDLKIASLGNSIAEINIKLLKAEQLPELSLYMTGNLQRPYTFVIPAVDIYTGVYQAGISLRYNISSLYQTPKKLKVARLELEKSVLTETLQKQNIELEIKNACIRYQEDKHQLNTLRDNLRSVEENYRIIEKKYFNQLALPTDMIDAVNLKIEAEIEITNTEINIVYDYYQLLKVAGKL